MLSLAGSLDNTSFPLADFNFALTATNFTCIECTAYWGGALALSSGIVGNPTVALAVHRSRFFDNHAKYVLDCVSVLT